MELSGLYFPTAFILGALHSFEPGHGKAIIAAYLLGSRGRVSDAFLLGAIVTFTHTFSVLVLAIAAKIASGVFSVEMIQPWVELTAGVLVIGVGIWMIYSRRQRGPHSHSHEAERSLGQLLVLGISGGLVPCPAGMALLLAAIAAGQMGRGINVILVFSSGVGVTTVALGVLFVKARSVVERLFAKRAKLTRRLPLLSATIITFLGLFLIGKAAIGLLKSA